MGNAARGKKRTAAAGVPKKAPAKKGKAAPALESAVKAAETPKITSTRASARLAAQTHFNQPPQLADESASNARKPSALASTFSRVLSLGNIHQPSNPPALQGPEQGGYDEHGFWKAPKSPPMPTSAQPSKHATQAEDLGNTQSQGGPPPEITPFRKMRHLSVPSSSSASPTPPLTVLRTPLNKNILNRPPISSRNNGHFFSTQGYTPPSHAREELYRTKSMILPPPSHPDLDFFRNPRTTNTVRNPIFISTAPAVPIPYSQRLTERADEGTSDSDDGEVVASVAQSDTRRPRLRLPGGETYVSSEDEGGQEDEKILEVGERVEVSQSSSQPADKDQVSHDTTPTTWRDPFSYIPAANTQSAAALHAHGIDQSQEISPETPELVQATASDCPPNPDEELGYEDSQSALSAQSAETCSDDLPLQLSRKSMALKNKTYGKGRSHAYKTGLSDPVRNAHRISMTPPIHAPTPQLDDLPAADSVPDSCLPPEADDDEETDDDGQEEGESELWSSQEVVPTKRGPMAPMTSRSFASPRKAGHEPALARGSPKKKQRLDQADQQSPSSRGSPLKLSRSASCQVRLQSYVQNIRSQKASRSSIRRVSVRRARALEGNTLQLFTSTPYSAYISQYRQNPGPLMFPTPSSLLSPDIHVNPRTQYASPGKTGKGRQYARRRTPPALYPTQGDPQWEDEIDCAVSVRGESVPPRGRARKMAGKKKRVPKLSLVTAASAQHSPIRAQHPAKQVQRQSPQKAASTTAQPTGNGKASIPGGGVVHHSPDNTRIVQRRHVLPTVVRQQHMLSAQRAAGDRTLLPAKDISASKKSAHVSSPTKPVSFTRKSNVERPNTPSTPAITSPLRKANAPAANPTHARTDVSTSKSFQSGVNNITAKAPPMKASWPLRKAHQSEEIAAFPSPSGRPTHISLSIAPADSSTGNASRLQTQVSGSREVAPRPGQMYESIDAIENHSGDASGDVRQRSGQKMSGLEMTQHLMAGNTGNRKRMSSIQIYQGTSEARVRGKSQSDHRLPETVGHESFGKRKRQETDDISEDGRVSPHSARHLPATPALARARKQSLVIPSSTQVRPLSALATPAGSRVVKKGLSTMITPTPAQKQISMEPVKSQAAVSATHSKLASRQPSSTQHIPHPQGRPALSQYPTNTLERTEMGSSARARMTQGLEKTEVGSSAAALKSRRSQGAWTQQGLIKTAAENSMRDRDVGGTPGLGLRLEKTRLDMENPPQTAPQARRWNMEDSSPTSDRAHLAPDAAFTQSSPDPSSLPGRRSMAHVSDSGREASLSPEAPPRVTQTLQRLRSRSLGRRSLGLRAPRSSAYLSSPQTPHAQRSHRTQIPPSSQKTPNVSMMPNRTQKTVGPTQTQKSRASRATQIQKVTQTQHPVYSQKQGGNPFAQYRSPLKGV
ncbi:hypothetical protein B9479_001698 [Cryptococcus floricola]|uniref:Uncharacterized protein n=1 Tax=Cryptococcus floricola TaxID=2591691 RepID=A0A5D3B5Q0_9TREE|nr:hypothetical protein B9479_001698 [Cryptococcus floricola]